MLYKYTALISDLVWFSSLFSPVLLLWNY